MICVARDAQYKRPVNWQRILWVLCQLKSEPDPSRRPFQNGGKVPAWSLGHFSWRSRDPRDTQRDSIKQAVKQKVAFGEEEAIVWHTERKLRG